MDTASTFLGAQDLINREILMQLSTISYCWTRLKTCQLRKRLAKPKLNINVLSERCPCLEVLTQVEKLADTNTVNRV